MSAATIQSLIEVHFDSMVAGLAKKQKMKRTGDEEDRRGKKLEKTKDRKTRHGRQWSSGHSVPYHRTRDLRSPSPLSCMDGSTEEGWWGKDGHRCVGLHGWLFELTPTPQPVIGRSPHKQDVTGRVISAAKVAR
jgi:hypothetical protein